MGVQRFFARQKFRGYRTLSFYFCSMAKFCSNCAQRYGMEIDINIAVIFKELKPGEVQDVLCEGCELTGIEKTKADKLRLIFREQSGKVLSSNQKLLH